MRTKPRLFSVIVPTYNRAHLLPEALASIKAQTHRPIEILLVDDGSSDGTAEIVEQWITQNEENALLVRYIFQKNSGAGAARNRGIKKMSGQYVQFFDSDDRLHPERFQKLVDLFEAEGCDFIQTGFEGFDAETGDIIQTLYGRPDENQLELALRGCLWANTIRSAFTAELIQRIGPWRTDMTCFEDREYVERAVLHAKKPMAIREVLASARRGGGTRISDKLRSYEGRTWRILCERHLLEAAQHSGDVSYAAKQAFASRIYALGFRSNGCGWTDLGQQCGEIAGSVGVRLDFLGQRRRLAWQLGRAGSLLYGFASSIKKIVLRERKPAWQAR